MSKTARPSGCAGACCAAAGTVARTRKPVNSRIERIIIELRLGKLCLQRIGTAAALVKTCAFVFLNDRRVIPAECTAHPYRIGMRRRVERAQLARQQRRLPRSSRPRRLERLGRVDALTAPH